MKVLLVTKQVIEDSGSVYRCTSNLYDILKRFSYLGELSIMAGRYNGKNSHTKIEKSLDGIVRYGNIKFSTKKDNIFMSASNKRILMPLIAESDLVISYSAFYDVYRMAKKYNKRFMSFVVSCAWDAYWNHGWQGKILAPYKFMRARYTIRHSDYVLYVSNEFLQKRYPTNAKFQCGCSNVNIPTMTDKTLANRKTFLEQWNKKELHIATLAAVDVFYKGQQYVIRALHELKKKGISNIHYHLLGGGNNSILSNIVKQYQLDKQVHFLGIVPHDEVFNLLDKMHIYIQPSLQEGLPRSMVEAMSRGLMCIGANTAAIPELIDSKYVTRRKSYKDIERLLESISKKELLEQAEINFDEAKNYQDAVLNKRRNEFFDKIIHDIDK